MASTMAGVQFDAVMVYEYPLCISYTCMNVAHLPTAGSKKYFVQMFLPSWTDQRPCLAVRAFTVVLLPLVIPVFTAILLKLQ